MCAALRACTLPSPSPGHQLPSAPEVTVGALALHHPQFIMTDLQTSSPTGFQHDNLTIEPAAAQKSLRSWIHCVVFRRRSFPSLSPASLTGPSNLSAPADAPGKFHTASHLYLCQQPHLAYQVISTRHAAPNSIFTTSDC